MTPRTVGAPMRVMSCSSSGTRTDFDAGRRSFPCAAAIPTSRRTFVSKTSRSTMTSGSRSSRISAASAV
jgi:hypothetical protein